MNEIPRRDFGAWRDLDLDKHRFFGPEGLGKQGSKRLRRSDVVRCKPEGLCQSHKIRVVEHCPDHPVVKTCLLVAQYISIRFVVEHQDDNHDAVLHGGGELLYAEHEAAVPRDRHDRFVRMRNLDTQGGWEAKAQRALMALRHVGSRLVDRVAEIRRKAHLAEFADKEAVARQRGTDDIEITQLWLHHLDRGARLKLGGGDAVPSRLRVTGTSVLA